MIFQGSLAGDCAAIGIERPAANSIGAAKECRGRHRASTWTKSFDAARAPIVNACRLGPCSVTASAASSRVDFDGLTRLEFVPFDEPEKAGI